jgi:DNA (cytosine-5)-methyltransferase 1
MRWFEAAPTITTQFYNFGSGRYGHPVQARAITLREGAILQSFPRNYRFVRPGERPSLTEIGRLIGNAVPVKLGKVIGISLQRHIKKVRRPRYPSRAQ